MMWISQQLLGGAEHFALAALLFQLSPIPYKMQMPDVQYTVGAKRSAQQPDKYMTSK